MSTQLADRFEAELRPIDQRIERALINQNAAEIEGNYAGADKIDEELASLYERRDAALGLLEQELAAAGAVLDRYVDDEVEEAR